MKKIVTLFVFATMTVAISCDESVMEQEFDENAAVDCARYVDSTVPETGDGLSLETAFKTMDEAIGAVKAIQKDGGVCEVVIADDDPRYSMLSGGEVDKGITVRKVRDRGLDAIGDKTSQNTVDQNVNSRRVVDQSALLNKLDPMGSKLSNLDRVGNEIVAYVAGSCTDSYTITGTSPYLYLVNSTASTTDWKMWDSAGAVVFQSIGSATTNRVKFSESNNNILNKTTIGNYTISPTSVLQIQGAENNGYSDTTNVGGLRINNTTSTTTPLMLDQNEIDANEAVGLWLNNNSKKQTSVVGPASAWTGASSAAPTGALQVSTASYLADTSTGSRDYILIGAGQIDAYNRNKASSTAALTYSKKDLFLQTKSGGGVAIGTVSATEMTGQKLVVDGSVKVEQLVIEDVSTADFVFADDYDLMPLEEVSRFIDENDHLPGIASAAEMEAEGLSVGEFQGQLLQKIEELTLYVIEQQKQIAALSKTCEAK